MNEDKEQQLGRLFALHGSPHEIAGNQPVLLVDHSSVWYIGSGAADVFAIALGHSGHGRNGAEPAQDKRRFLFTAEPGAMLFDFAPPDPGYERSGLLVAGQAGTIAYQLDRRTFARLVAEQQLQGELAAQLDRWLDGWAAVLRTRSGPASFAVLEEQGGDGQLLGADTFWRPHGTCWISVRAGSAQWSGDHALHASEPHIPITHAGWLEVAEPCTVVVRSTASWLQADPEWAGLTAFHTLAASRLALLRAKERELEHERLRSRTELDYKLMDHALQHLLGVTADRKQQPQIYDVADPLYMACRLVGEYAGIRMKPPARRRKQQQLNPVQDIAQASGSRSRKVLLKGEWWKEDNGPLVAFLEHASEPVALIPDGPSSYKLVNPANGVQRTITANEAQHIAPEAYMFYRPLPSTALGVMDILKFGAHKSIKRDVAVMLAMGAAAGVLGMFIPIATGILFDSIIPEAYRSPLMQMAGVLLAVTLAIALFQLAGSLASQRLEGRMDNAIQAAIWDRLLNLPVSFFRNYTAGDLASRANSINAIRQIVSGAVLGAIFSGIFSSFNYFLLFRYSPRLAVVAGVLVLISMAVTVLIGWLQIAYQRKMLDIQGRISGLVLQLLNSVSKFRMAAAENRAFFLWAKAFAEQKKVAFRSRMLDNYLSVFQSFFPLLTSMVLFYLVAGSDTALTAGQFIAFFAAFSAFLAAMLGMASAMLSLVHIVPLYERARPILRTLPEVHTQLEDPGELTGEIEARHLSFRYTAEQPLVLNNLTIRIRAGQMVAFVGASGCGKSTLMRLLLGFESPESGSIYYDGQDMRSLDASLLRSQFGVVLQNSKLMSGDIYTNIVGSSALTIEDAWEAATMAGMDDDIRSMPMGMHTVISEGGGTLSGGQRQRLLIARAIAKRPKILVFDEATSALDNRTQAIVSASLERLHTTRIVIAHRLSTITNADYIYVLDKGEIVQAGTYAQLVAVPGVFADLASRQLA